MAGILSKKLQLYMYQIIVSTTGVVEKKRFGETASIYFKALNAREHLK